MIVDFRCRPPTKHFLAYFDKRTIAALGPKFGARSISQAFVTGSMRSFIKEMDDAGIDYAVATGRNSPELRAGALTLAANEVPNAHLIELQKKYPRIVGFAGIDVSNTIHDALKEIDRFVGRGKLKGIFIEPQRALPGHPDDERIFPVYEHCQDMGVPVIIMTGTLAGSDISYADPTPIDRVASAFPKLRIVCGHGCWPRVAEIVAVALKHPNVFVSPDVYQFAPGSSLYLEAANAFMEKQYLFGTAYPIRPLVQSVADFKVFPLKPSAMKAALGLNAKRLLNLPARREL
jgi:predicted TIM-barrel fold metal-dependent hydrolase